jgi:hypothetical protein
LTANYAAIDSGINNQKLCRCQFRNRQPRTFPLPIQKSTAQNYVTTDSKIDSDGGVISALLLFFCFFFGVYNNSAYSSILFSHNSSLMHAKSIHYHEHEFLPQLMHVSMS